MPIIYCIVHYKNICNKTSKIHRERKGSNVHDSNVAIFLTWKSNRLNKSENKIHFAFILVDQRIVWTPHFIRLYNKHQLVWSGENFERLLGKVINVTPIYPMGSFSFVLMRLGLVDLPKISISRYTIACVDFTSKER